MQTVEKLLNELGLTTSEHAAAVRELVQSLVDHALYDNVTDVARARAFMEHQVWCVWDFMCLAKSVQIGVGCYQVPWVPPPNTALVQAANAILADEESDRGPDGIPASHLEIFIAAMVEAGADAGPINRFIEALRAGRPFGEAVENSGVPEPARSFMQTTMKLATGPLHSRVACFCLTREELVPRMFYNFIQHLPSAKEGMPTFLWYLHRHVELDTTVHGPYSRLLLRDVIGDDPTKRGEAMAAVREALAARKRYLDGTLTAVLSSRA